MGGIEGASASMHSSAALLHSLDSKLCIDFEPSQRPCARTRACFFTCELVSRQMPEMRGLARCSHALGGLFEFSIRTPPVPAVLDLYTFLEFVERMARDRFRPRPGSMQRA